MEALAKAAVAEICELVDDGYAVLHLEISRSQKENESLRKRLRMMELRAEGRPDEKMQEKPPDTWRDAESMTAELEDGPRGSGKAVKEKNHEGLRFLFPGQGGGQEGRPELIIIKEERVEEKCEDNDLDGEMTTAGEGVVELSSDGDNRSTPAVDVQITPTENIKHFSEQKISRASTWEDDELDPVLKADPDSVEQRGQHRGALNKLGYEYVIHQRPSRLQALFEEGSSETDTEGPACSYSKEACSDPTIHTELEGGSPAPAKYVTSSLSSYEPPEKSQLLMKDMIMSVPVIEGADAQSPWSDSTMLGRVYTHHRHYKEFGEREGLHKDILTNLHLPLPQITRKESQSEMNNFTSQSGVKAQRTREKRFICGYCGKCFTCPKYLQTHQRVHTGEKPYSCSQCGKRFAQSGYLKKHQNVHTGAKPFGCKQCGKRFADSSNLIRHRSVHTGERPFICTHCGERFAGKHNLKIHQQRNHPALWSAR